MILALLIFNISFWLYIAREKRLIGARVWSCCSMVSIYYLTWARFVLISFYETYEIKRYVLVCYELQSNRLSKDCLLKFKMFKNYSHNSIFQHITYVWVDFKFFFFFNKLPPTSFLHAVWKKWNELFAKVH